MKPVWRLMVPGCLFSVVGIIAVLAGFGMVANAEAEKEKNSKLNAQALVMGVHYGVIKDVETATNFLMASERQYQSDLRRARALKIGGFVAVGAGFLMFLTGSFRLGGKPNNEVSSSKQGYPSPQTPAQPPPPTLYFVPLLSKIAGILRKR